MNNNPIGIFDSGIGGLSTLKELRRQLPHENFIYIADLAWSPYGCKSTELLQQRAEVLCQFLLKRQVKAIVIACNTATAAAINSLRENYSLPIIGVEPGIKPAISRTLSGIVAILATERTIASEKFQRLLQQFHGQTRIISQACPGLADAIEGGQLQRSQRAALLAQFILPLLAKGVDTLVLGCTHYPLIANEIRSIIPETVELIDTSAAIARQVVSKLALNNTLNPSEIDGQTVFFSSAYTAAKAADLNDVFSWYLGHPAMVNPLC